MSTIDWMPTSQSPIVLRERLRQLEIDYARKRFEFEIQWANKTKRYGPKTLQKLIDMTNAAIEALKNEEERRWMTIKTVQREILTYIEHTS